MAKAGAAPMPAGRYQKLKNAVTDLFEIPDEVAGWLPPALVAGRKAIERHGVDVIFATGRPWTSLVIGLGLKRLTGRPLVVDFRDPWTTNPFRVAPSLVKDRLERALERKVIGGADLIIANTEHLRQEFLQRFGDVMETKCIAIPNGFDPEELAKFRTTEARDARRERLVLTHNGFLYGKRDPRALLEAIKLLHQRQLLHKGEIHCELIGSVELPYDLAAFVRHNGLDDDVVLRGQLSHAQSLAAVAQCDVALLLQPGTDTQIPSKLFEYIGLRKRVLTIARPGSASARMILENGLGEVADADDVESIAKALERCLRDWRANLEPFSIRPEVIDKFDVQKLVGQLSAQMARL